jgi:hypothetical protein
MLPGVAVLLGGFGCSVFGYQTGEVVLPDGGTPDAPSTIADSGRPDLVSADGGYDAGFCASGDKCTACGGTCCRGRCVVKLASGQDRPTAIAVDATHVYWANVGTLADAGGGIISGTGSIVKTPVGGGVPVTLASGQALPTGIVVDATNVYWTNEGDSDPSSAPVGTVMSVPLGGGAAITLASGQSMPQSIAVDATSVYWTNESSMLEGMGGVLVSGYAVKVPLGGGAVTTLASSSGPSAGIAVDATNVYWAAGGNVMSVPLNGGTSNTVTSDPSELGTVVAVGVDATNVYFTTQDGALKNQYGSVMSAPLGGGKATPLTKAGSIPGGLAALPLPITPGETSSSVYWTGGPPALDWGAEDVSRVSVDGDTPMTLAAGSDWTVGIAVDETSVFWTATSGDVMKLTPR